MLGLEPRDARFDALSRNVDDPGGVVRQSDSECHIYAYSRYLQVLLVVDHSPSMSISSSRLIEDIVVRRIFMPVTSPLSVFP